MSVLNYGLFHENVTLAYFVFLGDRSSALSASVVFFITSGFRMIVVGFFRDTPHNAKTTYRKGTFFAKFVPRFVNCILVEVQGFWAFM